MLDTSSSSLIWIFSSVVFLSMSLPLYLNINSVLYKTFIHTCCLFMSCLVWHRPFSFSVFLTAHSSFTYFFLCPDTFPRNLFLTYKWLVEVKTLLHCATSLFRRLQKGFLSLSNLSNTQSKPTLHYQDPFCLWIISMTLTEAPSATSNPSPSLLTLSWSFQHWGLLFLFLCLPGVALLICLCHTIFIPYAWRTSVNSSLIFFTQWCSFHFLTFHITIIT